VEFFAPRSKLIAVNNELGVNESVAVDAAEDPSKTPASTPFAPAEPPPPPPLPPQQTTDVFEQALPQNPPVSPFERAGSPFEPAGSPFEPAAQGRLFQAPPTVSAPVPSSPVLSAPAPPPPPPPPPPLTSMSAAASLGQQRNRGSKPFRIVASVVLAILLLGGSFVVGQNWSANNPVVPAQNDGIEALVPSTGTDLDAPINANADTPTVESILEVQPGPLANSNSNEPVADVAEALSPSIVVIEITDVSQGSGVVWDAENGYIVTNNHVVEGASTVSVRFADGQVVTGTVIGGDTSRDIAIVGVDPTEVNSLVQAVFAPASEVRVGQLAVAIGGPFGLEQSVTAGVVSAINRVLLGGGSDPANPNPVEMIQTDAPINPGNSGGALADRQGRIIGINTQIQTTSLARGSVGVGFAIPSDTIELIARRIVSGESLDVGYLGIQGETPTDGSPGALVTSVVAGSPAEISGLQIGDLIIAINGKELASMADLAAEVKLFRPTEVIDVLVLRDGVRLTLRAILGSA